MGIYEVTIELKSYKNGETIVSTLEYIQDPSKTNPNARSAASLLLPAVILPFLTYIKFWHTILMEVNSA